MTGCSPKNDAMQQALDFRTALLEAGGCTFQADLTAHYEDKAYAFSLDCTYDQEGAELTILEPQTLAGISATVSKDGTELEYDGVSLALGDLAGGNLAPMALPWLLGSGWTGGYIAAAGEDGDLSRLTYKLGYDRQELTLDTWLDGESCPVRCEVSYEGQMLLEADLSHFEFLP